MSKNLVSCLAPPDVKMACIPAQKEHPPTTLVEMLLSQERQRSEEFAVCDDTQSLRFRDLIARAKRLGSVLNRTGVGPGAHVGLFAESSTEMMIGLWGILFSGAAYLPLGTDYPAGRLAFMIRDAGLEAIVTQARLSNQLSEMIPRGIGLVILDSLHDINDSDADDFQRPQPVGSDPAYLIYTSGTTGAPKAVSIAELAIANQLFWLESEHGLRAGEIVLHKTPASFDAAQWELLAVCCGASVVMGPPGIYRNPSAIVEQIRRHRVTKLQGVPTLLQALVDTPEFEQCTTLDTIFSGGEALTRKLTARIFEALPGCRLVNLYGPTECTINATFYTVDANMLEGAPDMIPIGRPVANTACYVLSEELRELRDGEVGELYIGGKQLAKGYHNREELNSERFIYWIDPST
ncbi:amino acid adenylation domain-containing protein [Bradyrhizobium elkanii]